jgi:hypothetical protein
VPGSGGQNGSVTKPSRQPLSDVEGGQRLRIVVARQFEHPANVVEPNHRRGLGFGSEGTFGALEPGLGLLRPSLPNQHRSEQHAGDAGSRVVGPSVPLGELDRLPGTLLCPHKRAVDPGHRLVGQAAELEIGPPDPTGQRHALGRGGRARGHRPGSICIWPTSG